MAVGPGRSAKPCAALAAIASLMWAAIRWLVMRLSATTARAEDPAGLQGAISLGLFAYAFAVTPELRFLAWAASGAITAAVLVRLGLNRREVTRSVGLAWGAQGLVVAGGWIARAAVLAVLTTRV